MQLSKQSSFLRCASDGRIVSISNTHIIQRSSVLGKLSSSSRLIARAELQGAERETKRQDYIKGCKTVLSELQGLDFPRAECRLYFQHMTKAPKGTPKDFDMGRARKALAAIIENQPQQRVAAGAPAALGATEAAAALDDMEALKYTQDMLSEIWRWRRRGGGLEDEDDELRSYQRALLAIQDFKPEDIDRITSSVLDGLDMTEQQKRDIGGGVQQIAIAGISSAVWGSMAMCLLFLAAFNFLRAG